MADDKKASQLDPATDVPGAAWAAYQGDDPKEDCRLSVQMIRPGVSGVGIRLALGSNLRAVADAIDPDITNAVTIRWQTGARVSEGDALYAHIQSTLSWSSGQMDLLMDAAAAYE